MTLDQCTECGKHPAKYCHVMEFAGRIWHAHICGVCAMRNTSSLWHHAWTRTECPGNAYVGKYYGRAHAVPPALDPQ